MRIAVLSDTHGNLMRAGPKPETCNSRNRDLAVAKGAAAFITMESPIETTPSSAQKKDAAHRNADSHFVTWERRTSLVKQQVAAESAANDAKTARLRALRLAKEVAEREAAQVLAEVPKRRAPKRVVSVKV
jgi:hypothetical protein